MQTNKGDYTGVVGHTVMLCKLYYQ